MAQDLAVLGGGGQFLGKNYQGNDMGKAMTKKDIVALEQRLLEGRRFFSEIGGQSKKYISELNGIEISALCHPAKPKKGTLQEPSNVLELKSGVTVFYMSKKTC